MRDWIQNVLTALNMGYSDSPNGSSERSLPPKTTKPQYQLALSNLPAHNEESYHNFLVEQHLSAACDDIARGHTMPGLNHAGVRVHPSIMEYSCDAEMPSRLDDPGPWIDMVGLLCGILAAFAFP